MSFNLSFGISKALARVVLFLFRAKTRIFFILFFLGLGQTGLAAEENWDANLPKLERESTPFFSLRSGITLTTLNSLSLNQSNQIIFGGVSWQNESILTSSFLLAYQEHRDVSDIHNQVGRFLQYGPAEILWKPAHLGLRQEGLTTGYDLRLGISDYYRWGVSAIINFVRTERIRLDFRSGYLGEKMQVNLAPIERTGFPQTLLFSFLVGRFGGQIKTEFRFYTPWEKNTWEFEFGTSMRLRLFSIEPAQLSLALDLVYKRQPLLGPYGLEPNWFLGTLGLEIRI